MGTAILVLHAIAGVCFMAAGVFLIRASEKRPGGIAWAGVLGIAGAALLLLSAVLGAVWFVWFT